jgi:uncharacterized membrane protein (UPF0127 family)
MNSLRVSAGINAAILRPLCAAWLICVLAGMAACGTKPKLKTVTLELAGVPLAVEVAATQEARARGLMFRKSMPENAGMLFVFDRDGQQSFWMENTEIPLSIAYISSAGEIREIYDMSPHSRRSVHSTHAVRYALEVNQGTFEKLGITPGYVIKIPELPK